MVQLRDGFSFSGLLSAGLHSLHSWVCKTLRSTELPLVFILSPVSGLISLGRRRSVLIAIADLSYNLCQAFWTPGLPLLARNTPESVRAKQEYVSGDITEDEYQARVMLQRNKLSNYAFGAMSTGYTLTLIIALGAAFGLHANDSTHNNIRAAVVIVGIATGVWIVFGTPWFFIEKNRSNKLEVPLPAGSGKQSTFAEAKQYIVTGLKVYWNVLKHIPHLTQTWLYLVGFFLISDGFATTNQIYGIAQNTIVSYSTTTSTELYIVQGFSNLVGIAVFWLIQRHFRIRTKTILIVNCIFVILNAVWGMSSLFFQTAILLFNEY